MNPNALHPSGRIVKVAPDPEALARAAGREFVRAATRCVTLAGRFTVALAGGSTPRRLYRLLAEDPAFRDEVSWQALHLFWGDERPVPPDHPESNYRMAYDTMISRVPIPDPNVHRIPAERPDPAQAAAEYEKELRAFFNVAAGEVPHLDLILLGLGADGHTASLFPGTPAVHERRHLVVANWLQNSQTARITMTPPVLNGADAIHFLVSGIEKADAVAAVLEGPYAPDRWPAQVMNPPEAEVLWLLDRAAASKLTARTPVETME